MMNAQNTVNYFHCCQLKLKALLSLRSDIFKLQLLTKYSKHYRFLLSTKGSGRRILTANKKLKMNTKYLMQLIPHPSAIVEALKYFRFASTSTLRFVCPYRLPFVFQHSREFAKKKFVYQLLLSSTIQCGCCC